MSAWFLETGIYLLGLALIPAVGLLLVAWGLWGDRSKGCCRCPKCWYDMRGTVPKLECPECGHDAQQQRRLYMNHRRWGRVVIGVVLGLLSAYPLFIVGGWWREQAALWRYGIYFGDRIREQVGPPWLIQRLPDEFGRFFERRVSLYVDDPTQLAACRSLRHLRSFSARTRERTDYGSMELIEQSRATQVANADLVHLKGLSKLEKLFLTDTQVTDAGLVHLTGLSNLRELRLWDTQVADAGLVHLEGLPNLMNLGLSDTQVTDAGLVHLKRLSKLQSLYLSRTRVTDVGFVHLEGLTNLTQLGLSHTRVTDAGLVYLKELSQLRWLHLRGTQVTDAGLVQLKGLSQLRRLDLRGTRVTDAGLVQLKGLVATSEARPLRHASDRRGSRPSRRTVES
jgi:hypothetical protein